MLPVVLAEVTLVAFGPLLVALGPHSATKPCLGKHDPA